MAEWRYFHISTQATFTIASGGVSLIAVTVNNGAASAVVTVYDGMSATATPVIATINASAAGNFFYGNVCHGGLTVVQSGGSADVTIIFDDTRPEGLPDY